MADESAAALFEVLLADPGQPPEELLAATLRGDPPLVLWTICVAGRQAGWQPQSIADVAQWLIRHALEVLQWEPGQDAEGGPDGGLPPEAYVERTAATVQVADLAARLAGAENGSAAEAAFLLGLLSDAKGWLAMAGEPSVDDASSCLPDWLTHPADTPAMAAVDLAGRILAGEAPLPDAVEIDLDACRQRGAEAARRWLAPVPGLGERLPALTAKLARLATLEDRFEETVETEKLEAMAEFAAGAGHEINNPLAVIAGRAQYFLREEEDPERRRGLALMSAQAKRVYEMIADMMLFARPPKPEPELIDVVEWVDRVIEANSARAARQETTLYRVGDHGPVEIEVDPTQLTVALQAMCQNALEAIGHEGRIEIGVHRGVGNVEIRVCDDGPGMTPEERRHVFDPYYSARQAGRGLGLGLSKCWRIVSNHGGCIHVDSEPGQGAVFTIMLPQHQP